MVEALEVTGQKPVVMSAEEALAAAKDGDVDAVVSDYYQRIPNGTGFLKCVRLSAPEVARFLYTSRSELHIALGAITAGAVHRYILKSWEPQYCARCLSLALHALQPRMRQRGSSQFNLATAPKDDTETATRILIADDDQRITKGLARALRRHGFTVFEAFSGRQAMEIVADSPPEIALVDLVMPEVSGYEIVHHLKTNHAESTHVIVMTGDQEWETELAAFKVGADDYLTKPVHLLRLLQRIEVVERSRRTYAEMQLVAEESARLRVYVGEAAALLAHDIKNGLMVLSSNLYFLQSSIDDDSNSTDALEQSNQMVRKLAGLVRNFVDVARSDEGALPVELTRVDARGLIDEVVALYRPGAVNSDVTLDIDCASGLVVMVDNALLERVLHNLLSNSLRFVNTGGRVRVSMYQTSEIGGEPGWLFLEVGNTGPEIPKAMVPSLFARYSRVAKPRGRGMGLYFCRLVAEAHGGSIGLAPRADLAANFQLRLALNRVISGD